MATPAEAAVKKLARLPSNCVCANCGTTSKFGFSTVCIKYYTFVCNSCKSAHQAISHRCKSLTMSSWDQGEVLKLKTHGNDYARKVWLGKAPPAGVGGRPKQGDDINVFKRFVVVVYENKKYYTEAGANESIGADNHSGVASGERAPPVHGNVSSSTLNVRQERNAQVASARRAPAPAPKPAPTPAAPVLDLLDFGAFDSAPAPTSVPPQASTGFADFSQAQPLAAAAPSFDPFNNSSSNNTSSHPKSQNPPLLVKPGSSSNSHDPFASSTNPVAFAKTSNDPFAPTSITSTSNMNVSFDPFSNNSVPNSNINTANVDNMNKAKAPVMKNMNFTAAGNNHFMNNMNMSSNSNMMMNGGIMSNSKNNMMNNGMMNYNNNMMMNGMSNNNMGFNPQIQTMMMQQQNSFGRMNNMMQQGQPSNTGMNMHHNGMNMAHPMNINVMQPMNNNISNNFGSSSDVDPNKKSDPFSGLGI